MAVIGGCSCAKRIVLAGTVGLWWALPFDLVVTLITRRSQVQILPPPLKEGPDQQVRAFSRSRVTHVRKGGLIRPTTRRLRFKVFTAAKQARAAGSRDMRDFARGSLDRQSS